MAVSEWRLVEFGDLGGWVRGAGTNHVVVLHGGPGLSDYTEGFADLLADELGDAWTLVRYQQRGLAPSSTVGQFTVAEQVADLERVCDALTAEPVALVGHSWGGHLALHAAVAAPHRYRSLIIVDPLGAVPDGGMAAMGEHFAASVTSEEAAERARLEEQSTVDGPSAELGIADFAIRWRYYFADPTSAPPMPPIDMSLGAYIGVFASIFEHFENETLVRGLTEVHTPTLFIAGTHSPIPHEQSQRSAALMPAAGLVTIPTGHFPWIESAAATLPPIGSFLRGS